MDKKTKVLIELVITLPLALKVFKHDLKEFEEYYVGNLYIDQVESIMSKLQKDFNTYRLRLLKDYGITIQKQNNNQYLWKSKTNSGTLNYSTDDLRTMTSSIMKDYLHGRKAERFERNERVWKQGMLPPDAELE